MAFTLTYDLEGAGWAHARIGNGDHSVDIAISYLHDSLRDLGMAARSFRSNGTQALVVFMDEPGEHHLVVEKREALLSFELRWLNDQPHPKPGVKAAPKVVLAGTCTIDQLVSEVRKEFDALLKQYGIKGYKEKWRLHDFPEELHRDLIAATP